MKYNTKSTLQSIQLGEQLQYLFFWGHQPSKNGQITKSCLSQWWHAKFEDDQRMYQSAEQYMMAHKAMLFGDQEMTDLIVASSNPKKAKALGRKVKNFDAHKWELHKYQIVVKGNYLKFSQNTSLSEYLLSTGSDTIVEASPVDRIWGVGMAEDNPKIHDPNEWRGPNLLGFALMEVRDQLIKT